MILSKSFTAERNWYSAASRLVTDAYEEDFSFYICRDHDTSQNLHGQGGSRIFERNHVFDHVVFEVLHLSVHHLVERRKIGKSGLFLLETFLSELSGLQGDSETIR